MNQTRTTDSIHRHPLGFSALVIGADIAVTVVIKATSVPFSVEWSVMTTGIVSGAVLSVLAALVITRLGLWHPLGFVSRPERWRALLWFLPFVVYGVLPLTEAAHITGPRVAGAIAFGPLIAFWKLAALALITYAWLPRGARPAAWVAAVFWGVMHIGGILTGAVVAPTLLLALSYVFLGFSFVAVRMRTGILWPVVLAYALLLTTAVFVQDNDASNLVASVSDAMPQLVVSVLFAGYGLVAWRSGGARSHSDTATATRTAILYQKA